MPRHQSGNSQPNAEWEKQAATAGNEKTDRDGARHANPEGFASISGTASRLQGRGGPHGGGFRHAAHLHREGGRSRALGQFHAPRQDPPAVTGTKLEAADHSPDGTSTVFNPAKMPPATIARAACAGAHDGFHARHPCGCLIEIAYRTRHLLDASVPDFSEELSVSRTSPWSKPSCSCRSRRRWASISNSATATKNRWKPVRRHAHPLVETSRIAGLRGAALRSASARCRDDARRHVPRFVDAFGDMVSTADARFGRAGPGGEGEGGGPRGGKRPAASTRIRKAYEFVSALRYVAIEFGINGIRPRTPPSCSRTATAIARTRPIFSSPCLPTWN